MWTKKLNHNFYIGMNAYDGMETCQMVSLPALEID